MLWRGDFRTGSVDKLSDWWWSQSEWECAGRKTVVSAARICTIRPVNSTYTQIFQKHCLLATDQHSLLKTTFDLMSSGVSTRPTIDRIALGLWRVLNKRPITLFRPSLTGYALLRLAIKFCNRYSMGDILTWLPSFKLCVSVAECCFPILYAAHPLNYSK